MCLTCPQEGWKYVWNRLSYKRIEMPFGHFSERNSGLYFMVVLYIAVKVEHNHTHSSVLHSRDS